LRERSRPAGWRPAEARDIDDVGERHSDIASLPNRQRRDVRLLARAAAEAPFLPGPTP
jgi:hypothetical protein